MQVRRRVSSYSIRQSSRFIPLIRDPPSFMLTERWLRLTNFNSHSLGSFSSCSIQTSSKCLRATSSTGSTKVLVERQFFRALSQNSGIFLERAWRALKVAEERESLCLSVGAEKRVSDARRMARD